MNEVNNELDILHSGIMALEELLIQKGLITQDELNPLIQKCYQECKQNRVNGQKPNVQE